MKRLPRRICLLGGLLRTLYYRRVDILGTPCRDRPTLYLLSHRNGAIDGFVYQKALGDTPSLISVQLLRGPLRLLFLLQFRLRLVDGVADAVQIASVRRFGGGGQRQGGKQYGQYQRARGHSVKRVIKTADYSGIWRLRLFQTASFRHAARHRDGGFTI